MTVLQISGLIRLGTSPETIQTRSGKAFVKARAVQDHPKRGPSGEWEHEASWYSLKAWGRTAEALSKCFKGETIWISGTPKIEEWEGRDGVKRMGVAILLEQVRRVGRPQQEEMERDSLSPRPEAKPAQRAAQPPDDDFPF